MSALIKAYAKINLTLDITGKREDGYHLLCMVMQSISLYDEVKISFGEPGIRVICNKDELSGSENNTAYKAAELYFLHTGLKPNVTIHLKKNIPAQAGLGGGSADAAAVLNGLNKILDTKLSYETLCKIGLKIGADVPFCIHGGTALAEGIGEKLTPLKPMPDCYIVICKPFKGVDTKKAYALADAASKKHSGYTDKMLKAISKQDVNLIASSLGNEFEDVMHLSEVKHIKDSMISLGALGTCMTGSGSAVFGIFSDKNKAEDCKIQLMEYYSDAFLCHPIKSTKLY